MDLSVLNFNSFQPLHLLLAILVSVLLCWLVVRLQWSRRYTKLQQQNALLNEQQRLSSLDQERIDRLQAELSAREEQLQTRTDEALDLSIANAKLQERLAQQQQLFQQKSAIIEQAQLQLSNAFKTLSADALAQNSQTFVTMAQETFSRFQQHSAGELQQRQQAINALVEPIRQSLDKVDLQLSAVEKVRIDAYSGLREQMRALVETQLPQLHAETANLVKALRQPTVRGRWGEVQLRRVVEMAGMQAHCAFDEQVSVQTETGSLRPDMVIRLPGDRQVIVDAKAPLDAYLKAVEATENDQQLHWLDEHATQLRNHITTLGRKSYFSKFKPTPEFVVLFLPGEVFFSAALQADGSLIEYGAQNQVIPASPTTLIALLKAVSYGWQQEAITSNALEIARLGKQLYERVQTLGNHWSQLGSQLDKAVLAYNDATASLDSRVMVTARRFQSLQISTNDEALTALEPLTATPQSPRSAEFHIDSAEALTKSDTINSTITD